MNLEYVERVIALLDEFPVAEIEVSESGRRIAISRGLPAVKSQPPHSLQGAQDPSTDAQIEVHYGDPSNSVTDRIAVALPGVIVEAQVVGIFRHATPPLRAGTAVSEGQVLGAIESMRLLHDVFSPIQGRIAEVVQDDGRAVEYGSELFHIIPE
jgi:biotin carboxyl carrier protein